MENCIVFDDKEDLIYKLQQAMTMDEAQLAKMRKNVINYYETHLKAEVFIRRIEASNARMLPVLMYLEKNVARNSSKLNRNSILMHGTTFADKGWIRKVPQRFFKRL
jgi:oligoribonuclease (3'-5' exoribonuclease)